MDLRDRVIVALDVPDVSAAKAVVETLGDRATFYKVGYELAFVGGLAFAQDLATSGKKVFLDLKLHDIPNTIEKGRGADRPHGHDLPHRACLSADASLRRRRGRRAPISAFSGSR